jgi:hypothetical protein
LQLHFLGARELETLARLDAITLSLGRPMRLSDEEVGRIGERLKSNGADVQAPPISHARYARQFPACDWRR